MLLRSISKHVTDQNWFAVFLDLLIVVFGVFIGIQVSNWNQQLVGERQAKTLLNRLTVDLNNDQKALQSVIDYHTVVRNYAMTAVDALNDVNSISDEQFIISAYQTSQIHNIWTYRATYAEMLSTGQFKLIKNEQLKSTIFAYYSIDTSKDQYINKIAPYREFIRGFIPVSIQDTIKEKCGDVVIEVAYTYGITLPATCDLQFPNELASETAALLRSKPDMLFNLQFQIAVYDTKVFNLKNYLKESQKLIDAIKEYQH